MSQTKLLLGKYGGVPEDEQSELVHRIVRLVIGK